jgi:hypothetical protein
MNRAPRLASIGLTALRDCARALAQVRMPSPFHGGPRTVVYTRTQEHVETVERTQPEAADRK